MTTAAQAEETHARTARHHRLSKAEEHIALTWIREQRPDVFDRAAQYVDELQRLDTDHIRVEARDAS